MTPSQKEHIIKKFKQLTFRGYDRTAAYRKILAECELMKWEITQREIENII